MTTKPIGLYIHVPFCVKKCNYCDFCSFNLSSVSWRNEYIDRLCEEIRSYRGCDISVDSIFFGGGTPSLLTPCEFDRICSEINGSFNVLPQCEFTVEANPKTLDAEKLRSYKKNGVNRLSIGLQSIHENELKILGRIHLYEDFLASYNLVRKEGIDNINVDLMYGIPEQSMDSFSQTLDSVLHLQPEHISLYGLILEEGTPLYENRDKLNLPDEDSECDMYYMATRRLRNAGYNHYEISNYALPGRECRHNLKYWRCREYIGIGVAAYSYFDGKRFDNSSNVYDYLSCESAPMLLARRLTDEDRESEFIMLALRLCEGISLEEYKSRFNKDLLESKKGIIKKYIDAGLMTLADNRLALTERGFYVSNSIICDFI